MTDVLTRKEKSAPCFLSRSWFFGVPPPCGFKHSAGHPLSSHTSPSSPREQVLSFPTSQGGRPGARCVPWARPCTGALASVLPRVTSQGPRDEEPHYYDFSSFNCTVGNQRGAGTAQDHTAACDCRAPLGVPLSLWGSPFISQLQWDACVAVWAWCPGSRRAPGLGFGQG